VQGFANDEFNVLCSSHQADGFRGGLPTAPLIPCFAGSDHFGDPGLVRNHW